MEKESIKDNVQGVHLRKKYTHESLVHTGFHQYMRPAGRCVVGRLVEEQFSTVKKHNIEVLKGILVDTLQNKLTVNNAV